MGKISKRHILIAVVVIVVLLVALPILGFSPLSVALVPVNSTTQGYCADNGWHGIVYEDGWLGSGAYPSGRGPGEILSSTAYYYSWSKDGQSEYISVQGAATRCDGGVGHFANAATAAQYRYTINTGAGFATFRTNDVPDGVQQVPFSHSTSSGDCGDSWCTVPSPQPFRIGGVTYKADDGSYKPIWDGSVLRTELWIQTRDSGGVFFKIAQDESRLINGAPEASWEKALYAVNDTATMDWQIPAVKISGGNAYYLTIVNENTGTAVAGTDGTLYDSWPIPTTTGKASVRVDPTMFSSGGANRIRFLIYSPIMLAGVKDTAAIDNPNLAPTVNSVSVDPPQPHLGDTITISYSARSNPSTNSPITRYHVLAYIGGTTLYDQDTTQTSVSFGATTSGDLLVQVTAYDAAGRPSAVYDTHVNVGNVIDICSIKPDLQECKKNNLPDTNFGAIAAFLIAGLALLLLGIFLKFLPGLVRALMVLGGIVLLVVGIYFLGLWVIAVFQEFLKSLTPHV